MGEGREFKEGVDCASGDNESERRDCDFSGFKLGREGTCRVVRLESEGKIETGVEREKGLEATGGSEVVFKGSVGDEEGEVDRCSGEDDGLLSTRSHSGGGCHVELLIDNDVR